MNSHSYPSITGTDQLESESYTFGHSPVNTEPKKSSILSKVTSAVSP